MCINIWYLTPLMSDYYPSSVSSGPTNPPPWPCQESGHRPKGQGPAMASLGLTKASQKFHKARLLLSFMLCFLISAKFDLYFLDVFKGPRPRSLRKNIRRPETSFDIKSSHCKLAQVYIRISQNPAASIGSILAVLTGPMSPPTVVTCHVSGHPKNRQQHHIDLGRVKCPNSGGYLRHPPCGLPILVPHVWRSRTCLKLDPCLEQS